MNELRFRFQLWLIRSRLLCLTSWLRVLHVHLSQGLGKFGDKKLRPVPPLTSEQIAFHGGIGKSGLFTLKSSADFGIFDPENDHLFTAEAAHKAFEHLDDTDELTRVETQMTMPYERTRAILETKKLLQELLDPAVTPRVPKAVRETARTILRHYPSYAEIELAHKALPHLYGPVPPFSRMQGGIETVNTVDATKQNGS